MKAYLWIPLLWLCLFGAQAQNKEKSDSLVRLISAKKMEQVERDGENYRKVTGPARFLHNDTYLLCDTAFWNMNTSIIDCIGHVSILQEDTRLTSDKLTYIVDDDLAQFRGSLVELEDKEGNMLRTQHLDYNTKDSVAVFMHGGAMRDHTGQIIESIDGKYESKIKLFTFLRNVNMFTDSVFIKTSKLLYHSNTNLAEFSGEIDAWHEKSMLSSEEGWYDRNNDLFFFRRKVHGQDETKEAWSDSLYFNRMMMELEMLGNAQVTDTTRNAHAMAGRMFYQDSISTLTMTRDPVVIGVIDGQEGQPADTVYSRADKYIYRTKPRFAVDSSMVGYAMKRLKDLEMDSIAEYRKKAAEAAAQKAAEAAKLDPNNPVNRGSLKKGGLSVADNPKGKGGGGLKGKGGAKAEGMPSKTGPEEKPAKAGADSAAVAVQPSRAGTDSTSVITGPDPTSVIAGPDSTSVIAGPDRQSPADSTAATSRDSTAAAKPAAPKDSTKISFLTAIGNVKVFKKDLQVVTDSLEYNAIDSLIRMYKRPLIWNDPTRQYTSDSLFAVVRGQHLEKASLMSDAFVTIQEEDAISYDQIRSTEMMAYFDTTGTIRRFDALGDADAIFYIKEDSTYATINITKSKMLSAGFKDGEIDVVHYYDASKSDAYPLAQTRKEQRTLKGFEWQQEKRPTGPWDITTKTLRPLQRKQYSARPEPKFTYTDIYYPGYIAGVKDEIEANRLARERRRQEKARREAFAKDSLAKAALRDSLAHPAAADSLLRPDSLKTASDSLKTAVSDSLSAAVADSLKAAKPDSLAAPLTAKELKAIEKEKRRKEKEALAKAKQEAREREWARLDSLDAVKAAAKAAKKLKKEREKKRKIYLENLEQERKEKILLEKYIDYYRRKKAADEQKAAAKALKQKKAKKVDPGAALKPKDSQ